MNTPSLPQTRSLALSRPPQGAADWLLLQRASGGHEPSARLLVRQLTPVAHGMALQLLRHPQDAEDAVQDAFARLWSSRAADGHGATLATYFNTIVINRCKTRLVQKREWATDPDDLAPLADAQQQSGGLPATAWAPEADAPAATGQPALKQDIESALHRLPARQRMALAMWAYADAEVPDIARSLDLAPNAAHQLLHRARLAMKRLLTGAST